MKQKPHNNKAYIFLQICLCLFHPQMLHDFVDPYAIVGATRLSWQSSCCLVELTDKLSGSVCPTGEPADSLTVAVLLGYCYLSTLQALAHCCWVSWWCKEWKIKIKNRNRKRNKNKNKSKIICKKSQHWKCMEHKHLQGQSNKGNIVCHIIVPDSIQNTYIKICHRSWSLLHTWSTDRYKKEGKGREGKGREEKKGEVRSG